eukprot:6755436-Ditylum_brightwellii.AAC.1
MGTKRTSCATVVLDGKLVVVGGWDGTNNLAVVEEYNPQTERWTLLPSMETKRSRCAAVVMD